jgi:hypothetical protein
MSLQLTRIFGVLLAVLVLAGLTMNGHWLGLMNVDTALDLLRIVLAAAALYIGFVSRSFSQARSFLTATAVLYVAMALFGLISPTLFGLLPSGLTGFDIVFHLVTGILAGYGASHAEHRTLAHR